MNGLIFDIQGFSVHDGPGCRTLIFMSGCPLRCSWCSNPEGQNSKPKLLYFSSKCNCSSFYCISACTNKAVEKYEGILKFDRTKCNTCTNFECIETCPKGALKKSAEYYTKDELIKIIKRDRNYWGEKGGITFGGGDPIFQADFVRVLMKKCREMYINTAVETSAYGNKSNFFKLMEFSDWAFIDIKHMDTKLHKQETGKGNEDILQNIINLKKSEWPGRLIIRFPVISGYNDSSENLKQTAQFLKNSGIKEINIIPYHMLGESKYKELGMECSFSNSKVPKAEVINNIQEFFLNEGLLCYLGHKTPF